jgi:hypothetical protein
MRIFVYSFLLSLFCATSVVAQDVIVLKGTIVDEAGQSVQSANIYLQKDTTVGTTSDPGGNFTLSIDSKYKKGNLIISDARYTRRKVAIKYFLEGKPFEVTVFFKTLGEVKIYGRNPVADVDSMPKLDARVPTPSGHFEGVLATAGLGVSVNNELSSGYSVRGGNYNENLIYVNDIQIYRPFLARSGQQEGLSFINSDLIDNITFHPGGFEAKYGDKLSSVLDIKYKRPKKFAGSTSMSLLGGNMHLEGVADSGRFYYLTGVRYRSNAYVLSSLQTKGDYKPVFADVQALIGYDVNSRININFLGHYSLNKYRFVPQTRETQFGTINEALRLTVFFDGQEITEFETFTGALTTNIQASENTDLKFIASAYKTFESERFDIQGQYWLDELERDLGSDEFGDVAFNRGVGTFLNHARNRLEALVFNVDHKGTNIRKKGETLWGVKYRHEVIEDKLSEWNMIDSADFSIPQAPGDEILLQEVLKADIGIQSNRIMGYLQNQWNISWPDTFAYKRNDTTFTTITSAFLKMNLGVRANYWDYNGELVVSPRFRISYRPNWTKIQNDTITRRNVTFRFSTGFYYQPPFYRELRDLGGVLNPELKAQKSIHFVAGSDVFFQMWNRDFKFTGEAYYKHLTNVIPYEIDNVRIRYYANNNAKAYAAGLDFKIHGEFIKDIDSWATFSLLQTKEDILDDFYYDYFNADGEKIIPGFTFNNEVVDSVLYEPGYIPRPTDQFVSFGLYFQDEMPKWNSYKVHLNLLFGSKLPFGPPSNERYKDTLRTPPYRRVDIGFSKDLIVDQEKNETRKVFKHFNELVLSVEVFNLLGIDNTISYTWIKDVSNRLYAIPNFLTARRINVKLIAKF